MSVVIADMTIADYDAVFALWSETDGIGLSEADRRENVETYLARNPSFSLVARQENRIVGAVLCGHDGRRGYLHHLAVAPRHRNAGIGRAAVEHCLNRLSAAGIQKCHLFVIAENQTGIAFWKSSGWTERVELSVLSSATYSNV